MKRFLFVIAVLATAMAGAQEAPGKSPKRAMPMDNFSPEQLAEIQTKKMTLALELDEKQQREVLKMNTDLAHERKQRMGKIKAAREKGERLSQEERFKQMNEQLDRRIEVQRAMKKILNEEQYKRWKVYQEKRAQKMCGEMKHRRGGGTPGIRNQRRY